MNTGSAYHFTQADILNEEEQIRLAKKDPARFDMLYNRYHGQLFLFILKRVETETEAADITSQVFLKALLNLSRYRFQGVPFASWLYRIARNEISRMFSSRRITAVVSIESTGICEMIAEMEEKEEEEKYNDILKTLKILHEEELELIELRFFEKRPFKEIGEILGITENNAKVKTYRVLDKLKAKLCHGK